MNDASTDRQHRARPSRIRFTYQAALGLLLVALIVLFGILQPVFFHPDVLFDATSIVGEIGIMALAMTFIITTGGIDLSVGYILQLSAIVFGAVLTGHREPGAGDPGAPWPRAPPAASSTGSSSPRPGSRPLVTTLATMNLFRGISFIIAGSTPTAASRRASR